jgi:hypothetical protein
MDVIAATQYREFWLRPGGGLWIPAAHCFVVHWSGGYGTFYVFCVN